jgi:hypothetical protein
VPEGTDISAYLDVYAAQVGTSPTGPAHRRPGTFATDLLRGGADLVLVPERPSES